MSRRLRRVLRRRRSWLPWFGTFICILAILALATYFERESNAEEPAPATSPRGTVKLPAGPIDYVVLGDSYVAGPGIPDPLDSGVPGCDRSTNGWAEIFSRSISATLKNVSCSGATIGNFTSQQRTSSAAIFNRPQFDALNSSTRLVTLQIGLNDLRLISIIAKCVGLAPEEGRTTPCRDRLTDRSIDLEGQALALRGPLNSALETIAQRSPNAQVAVVGYPRILPASGPGCWDVMGITSGDMRYFDRVERRINETLSAAAGDSGVAFIDTYVASANHDACRSESARWVEPALPAYPKSGPYALHPNAAGARASARVVGGRITR